MSAKQTFAVLLHVDGSRLGTLLEVTAASSKLISVTTVVVADGEMPPSRAKAHYKDGRRNKGISGDDLLAEILASEANKVWSFPEIAARFAARGFAAASSVLSKACAENKVVKLGDGKYCKPGTTIHIGAQK